MQVRHYERDILPAPILRYLSSVTCLGDFLLDTEGLDLPTAQQLTARLSSATPTPNSTTPNSSSNLNTEPTRSGVEAAQPQGSGWALCLDGWVYAPSLPAGLAPGCLPHVATLYSYITPDMPEDVGPVVQAALTVAEMRARGQALAAAMPHMRSVQVTLAPGAALGTNTHMALVLALLQGLTSSSAHASSHASSSGDGLTRLSIVFDYGDDLPPGNDDESELSCEECVAAIMALAQAATTTAAGSSAGSDSAGAARGLRSIETANCRMDALDACGRLLACLGSPIQQLRELYDERD